MKTTLKSLGSTFILLMLVALFIGPAYAQGSGPITAQVDRTTLSTDETLQLHVTINSNALMSPNPELPDLPGFNVVGSSSSTSISIINGGMTTALINRYQLQPRQAGMLVIEPVTVVIDGQTFSTEPISIEVTQGTGNAQPSAGPSRVNAANPTAPTSTEFAGQNLFIEAEVDNPTPYLGEQVSYTFRVYQAVSSFGQPHYQAPNFTGFWSEGESEQSNYRVQAAGNLYDVTELRTVLFPTTLGPVTIEPAIFSAPGSFFSSGATLQTQPVTLEVKPLPVNAPASFTGAVGQYQLSATTDTTESSVNEPITWQVSLYGRGNIHTLPDPIWPEIEGWRSFESQATVDAYVEDGYVSGSRKYERLLVPGAEGQFSVPSLEYAYFDPTTAEYKTLTTLPIPVSVAPGAPGSAPSIQNFLPQAGVAVEQLATDIRHLKPAPDKIRTVNGNITDTSMYWLMWGVPLMGLAGHAVWQRRERYWQNNANIARSSQAHKKAKQALHQAKNKPDIYSAAGLVLTDYLADKLDRPVAGLTRQALTDLLAANGLNPQLIERVDVCLTNAELGRYSPNAGQSDHSQNLLKEVENLLKRLEKAI